MIEAEALFAKHMRLVITKLIYLVKLFGHTGVLKN
nr:MAG TPA: hypothetical protein [Caudoviricetes sp.]